MADSVRIKKFTPKVVVTLVAAITLVAVADPQPSEPYFAAALGVIVLGEIIRIWAAGHLQKNQELTTTGPYSRVKNPLYVGTILITTGMCVLAKGGRTGNVILDNLNWGLLGFSLLTFLAYYIPYKRKREGDRLREIFGEQWDVYDRNVPDYFPRLTSFRHPNSTGRRWTFGAVCENSEQWTAMAVAVLALAISFNEPIIRFFGSIF